ncbi:hypothetical protein FRC04_008522, partial [Tulasnella sp. 424]
MISYLQQTGRAGHDQEPAEAILYYPEYEFVQWQLNRKISDKYTIDEFRADKSGGMPVLYELTYSQDCFQATIG